MNTKTESNKSFTLTDKTVGYTSSWQWAVPLFAGVALLVLLLSGLNVELFYWLNQKFSYANDGVWTHLSLLADGQFMILFVLPFLGRRPDIVWQYMLAAMLSAVYVPGMKKLFSELRPPAVLLENSFHVIGPALQNNAFPSGHTTAAFVLAGLVCLQRIDVSIKFAALILAILVGFSRIANGVHWPLDVLGGALGGWLIALGAVWLSQHWHGGLNIKVQRAFALFVVPLAVWGVWSLWQQHDDVYPGTELLKVIFIVTCLGLSIPGLLRLFDLRK